MLIARLGRDSLDTDSQIEEFVRDDQGKERTKRIIPADLERVLKQSAHFWKSDQSASTHFLLSMGLSATIVYEIVISASPILPCFIVVTGSAALLSQQASSESRELEPTKWPKALQALIAGNVLALALYFGAQIDFLLRFTATFHIVIVAIIAAQQIVTVSADEFSKKLITGLIKPALEQRAQAKNLSSELLKHLVDPNDASQGCALIRLSESPNMDVVIEDSSPNFVSSFKDCKQKTQNKTNRKEFLTNLVCKEVVSGNIGLKRKLVQHLSKLKESLNSGDTTLNCAIKVSSSLTGSLNCPAIILMEIKKMAHPGDNTLYLLKTSKRKRNELMPDLRKVRFLCSDMDSISHQNQAAAPDRCNTSSTLVKSYSKLSFNNPITTSDSGLIVNRYSRKQSNSSILPQSTDNAISVSEALNIDQQQVRKPAEATAKWFTTLTTQQKSNEEQAQPVEETKQTENQAVEKEESDTVMINTCTSTLTGLSTSGRVNLNSNSSKSLVTMKNFQSPSERPRSTRSALLRQQFSSKVVGSSSFSSNQPKTQEEIFVYQIIHDLRHPLDAQKAKTEEIRKGIQKKYKLLQNLFGTGRQKFRANYNMKRRLTLFDDALLHHCESKLISGLSLKEQFDHLQKLNSPDAKHSKQMVRSMSLGLNKEPPLSDDGDLLSYSGQSQGVQSENQIFQDDYSLRGYSKEQKNCLPDLAEKSMMRLSSLNPNVGLINPLKEDRQQINSSFGAKGSPIGGSKENHPKISAGRLQLLDKGEDLIYLIKEPLSSNSIPDKEIVENSGSQRTPARKADSSKLLESVNSQKKNILIEEDEEQKLGSDRTSDYSVGTEGGEQCGVLTFNESINTQGHSEAFKRRFGEGKDIKKFCKEHNIPIPKQPQIQTGSHFGTSLAQERLFIESKVTERAKFDILGLRNKTSVLDDKDGKGDQSPKRTQNEPFRKFHENISSVKSHLLSVINEHKRAHPSLSDSSMCHSVAIQARSRSIEESQVAGGQNSLLFNRRAAVAEQTDIASKELLNLLSTPENCEFLMLILMERRLQADTIDQMLKYFKQVREEFEQIEAQQNMSMFLMKDLLDHAQLKAGSFNIINEFFDLESVIKMAYTTNQKFAKDKNISLIGPTYSHEEEKKFFKSIFGDPRRYLQVLVNFVNNAVKFTASGGSVTILLELVDCEVKKTQLNLIKEKSQESSSLLSESFSSAASDNNFNEQDSLIEEEVKNQKGSKTEDMSYVEISFKIIIRDTGVGISEANREKLFQNFAKLDETKRQNQSGVGLGLTIARDLVQAFGGSIEIEQPFEIGTDFVLNLTAKSKVQKELLDDLPAAKVILKSRELGDLGLLPPLQKMDLVLEQSSSSSSSIQESQYSRQELNSSSALSKDSQIPKSLSRVKIFTFRRCLVANDSTFLLDMLVKLTQKEFDEVVAVTDGQQAVDKVLQKSPDYFSMIILDINMPQMDGVSACIEISSYFKRQNATKGIELVNLTNTPSTFARAADQNQRKSSFQEFTLQSSINLAPIRKSTEVIVKQPLLFALTSDIDSDKVDYYVQNGFHSVYEEIIADNIIQMLNISNLAIRSFSIPSSSIGDDSSIVFEDQDQVDQ